MELISIFSIHNLKVLHTLSSKQVYISSEKGLEKNTATSEQNTGK